MNKKRNHCADLRIVLLDVHRTLIELERRQYEKRYGAQSSGEFLQVIAFSEEMRWLEPLSRLIVMLDNAVELEGDAAGTQVAAAARLRDLLKLNRNLDGSFSSRYTAYFDSSPELAHLHARLLNVLKNFV